MTAAAFPVPAGTGACHPSWHAGHAPSGALPSLRWIRIDPHLRGRVTPDERLVTRCRRTDAHRCTLGAHLPRAAAYVHDDAGRVRWILAVVEPGAPAPAFAARLDAHHRWMRRRGGAPLPAQRARDAEWWRAWADRPVQPWWKVRADW